MKKFIVLLCSFSLYAMQHEDSWEKSTWHQSCEQQACGGCCMTVGLGHCCYATAGAAAKAVGLIPADMLGVCEVHPAVGLMFGGCCIAVAVTQASVQFGRDEMHSCVCGNLYNGILLCKKRFQAVPAGVCMGKKEE